MMLEMRHIDYGTQVIEYRLERRERGTLEIAVEPDGLVRVTAPTNAAVEDIADRVRRRARWILAQQRPFAEFRPRTPARRYVPGETHLYMGRQYRIRAVPGENATGAPDPAQVKMVRGFLEVTGIAFDDTAAIEKNVTSWFRKRAHSTAAPSGAQSPKISEPERRGARRSAPSTNANPMALDVAAWTIAA